MINIVVDQICGELKFEVDCKPHPVPGQPLAVMALADELAKRHATIVVSGSLAEDMVLRILRRVREGIYKPEEVNLCVRWACNGEETISAMPVNERGDFMKGWPGGFFDHRLDELF